MTRAVHGRALCCLALAFLSLGGSASRSVRAASGPVGHRAIYAGFDSGAITGSIDAGLSWMAIGSPHLQDGDKLSSLAVDGGTGSILYAGAGSGIYRSGDAGRSWSLNLPGGSAVATAPGVAGMAYALIRSGSDAAGTLARTTDGGAHWSRRVLPSTGDSGETHSIIAVDPGHPSTLVLQGGAPPLLSDDGGQTWRHLDVGNLVWDPGNANVAYAVGDGGSFEKSTDRGAHWHPLPFPRNVDTLLAAVPGGPTTLLSVGSAPPNSTSFYSLYCADEGHPQWQPVLQDRIGTIVADPLTPGVVLASGESALYRSADGGAHWTTLRTPFSPYVQSDGYQLIGATSLAVGPRPVSPSDPLPEDPLRATAPAFTPVRGVLYSGSADAGDQNGVYQASGSTSPAGCGALPSHDSVTAMVVDPRRASTIYAGTTGDLYGSTDSCTSWHPVPGAPSGSISALAIDPASGVLYAAVLPNRLWVGAGDGAHWQQHLLPAHARITALVALPEPSTTLLVGTSAGVFATRDGGASWLGGPQLHDGVNAFAVDPSAPRGAWAVGLSGVFHTADAGNSWRTLKVPALNALYPPAQAAVPSHRLQGYTAVATNGRGMVLIGDDEGNIYVSPDRGRTWTGKTADSGACGPEGCYPISAVGFDPADPAHALAVDAINGRDDSYDGGATWAYFAGSRGGGYIDLLVASPRSPLPTDPVAPPAIPAPGTRYVPATRHTIGVPFLAFYDKNGGLRLLGLPLTEAYTEAGQTVQVFERARLVAGAGGVGISPLGSWLTSGQAFPTAGAASGAAPGGYAARTRQVVSGRFWSFYQAHHGSLLLGAPISPLVPVQAMDGAGHTYVSQWFENGRLEYHPELAGTPFVVSLGLVGVEFLRQRNWL